MASDGEAALDRSNARGTARATTQPTVLFLAANPVQVGPLQIGEECRAIEEQVRTARFRDRIRFRSRWVARPDDLLQALVDDAPSVLHFSGYGAGAQGLSFRSEDGSALSMSPDNLAAVMQAAGDSVSVVVLNACYSEVQARALVAHVPCTIATPEAIGEEAALIYAATFYRALAAGRSVANAHQHGLAALALLPARRQTLDVEPSSDGAQHFSTPTLWTHPGIDAEGIYIIQDPGAAETPHSAPAAAKQRCTIVIKASLEDFSAEALARITEELRRQTGDLSISIVAVEEGSVRLTFSLSKEGAKTIVKLRAEGQLNQIDGLEVSAAFDPEVLDPKSFELSEGQECNIVGDQQIAEIADNMQYLKGIALCCGFNDYDVKPLRRAVNDAAMLYTKLIESGMYNADPDLIGHGMLFTGRTSGRAILDAFTRAALSTADLVWFSFSGHSVISENGELRLLLPGWRQDGSEDGKRMYSIGADEIENALRSHPANKKFVIVLDSCQSGAFGNGLVTRDVTMPIEQRIASAGAVVISSCTKDQLAADGHIESRDLNGEFTGAVIETLEYHARTGTPLKVLQLFSSAKDKIKNGQTPTLYTYRLTDDFLVFGKASPQRRSTSIPQGVGRNSTEIG